MNSSQAARSTDGSGGSVTLSGAARWVAPLRFGVALHVGEVGYGNIGGANRLDFTAIGPPEPLNRRRPVP